MPVYKMTPEETREWLGSGLVIPVRKPPSSPEKSSTPPEPNLTFRPDSAQEEQDLLLEELAWLERKKTAPKTSSETLYPPPQPEQLVVGPGPLGVDVPPDSSPETMYRVNQNTQRK